MLSSSTNEKHKTCEQLSLLARANKRCSTEGGARADWKYTQLSVLAGSACLELPSSGVLRNTLPPSTSRLSLSSSAASSRRRLGRLRHFDTAVVYVVGRSSDRLASCRACTHTKLSSVRALVSNQDRRTRRRKPRKLHKQLRIEWVTSDEQRWVR